MWDECNPHGAADSGNDADPITLCRSLSKAPPPAPSYLPLHLSSPSLSSTTIMKSFALLTASALLSTASAEVYKLKLGKVPLEDQLVRVDPCLR